MFARKVSLQLKPNSVAEFAQTIEKDIISLLRKQPSFQDKMVFVVPGGTEEVANSTYHTIAASVATWSGQVLCVRWGGHSRPFSGPVKQHGHS